MRAERKGNEGPGTSLVRQQVREAHPGRPRLLPGLHAGVYSTLRVPETEQFNGMKGVGG